MKVLHISIPKNAGTYIANSLAPNFTPEDRYIVDENRIKLGEFLAVADDVTTKFKFVAGHIPFKLVEPHAHKFDLVISSYREPWIRCWSAFRFITARMPEWSHLNPVSNEDVGEKFDKFVEQYFIANRFTRNNQCGFLGQANLPASAMQNIDTYKINMLSCANLGPSLRALALRANLKINEQAAKNETSDKSVSFKKGDDPALDQKIFNWFDGDFALYDILSKQPSLT